MEGWTEAIFYRPGLPPPLDAAALADFLERFAACEMIGTEHPILWCRINFGERIDGRVRPFFCTRSPRPWPPWALRFFVLPRLLDALRTRSARSRRIPADLELLDCNLLEVVRIIRAKGCDAPARVSIGGYVSSSGSRCLEALAFFQSPEWMEPGGWQLDVGPIEIQKPGDTAAVCVGWMSLTLSGFGYYLPGFMGRWIAQAEEDPHVSELIELLRSAFPGSGSLPPKDLVALRREHPDFWPVGDPEAPLDWSWVPG